MRVTVGFYFTFLFDKGEGSREKAENKAEEIMTIIHILKGRFEKKYEFDIPTQFSN